MDRDGADGAPERRAFDEMQKFLVEMLRCEQLIVLSGLGTSLGVSGAPAMWKLWEECEKLGGADFPKLCTLCNYPLADATCLLNPPLARYPIRALSAPYIC